MGHKTEVSRLAISREKSYRDHLNQYDVIKLNMQEFLSATKSAQDMIGMLERYLIFDLTEEFDQVRFRDT